jgi:hypothetical protein
MNNLTILLGSDQANLLNPHPIQFQMPGQAGLRELAPIFEEYLESAEVARIRKEHFEGETVLAL